MMVTFKDECEVQNASQTKVGSSMENTRDGRSWQGEEQRQASCSVAADPLGIPDYGPSDPLLPPEGPTFRACEAEI